jgi:ParB-like chromosome segregation protein Spo0J
MDHNVNEALKQLLVPIDRLSPDPNNARAHDDRSIDAIATSLKEYGQLKPVIALPGGRVVAGNGTLAAAKKLGWKKIAVVRIHDEAKAKAFAVLDNRSAELSEWNPQALAKVLEEIAAQQAGLDPAELVGFSQEEIDAIILGGAPLPSGGQPREYDESAADGAPLPPLPRGEVACPSCGHKFAP